MTHVTQMQSDQINELATALSKAQGEITGALKDSQNPFFKSKYADLASVWDACRGPLSKNGLAVVQTTSANAVITTLMHSSGQWIRGEFPVIAVDNKPQSLGSAVTYARRYSLAAIVGVAQVDDDGEAAQGARQAPAPTQTQPRPAPATRPAGPQDQRRM